MDGYGITEESIGWQVWSDSVLRYFSDSDMGLTVCAVVESPVSYRRSWEGIRVEARKASPYLVLSRVLVPRLASVCVVVGFALVLIPDRISICWSIDILDCLARSGVKEWGATLRVSTDSVSKTDSLSMHIEVEKWRTLDPISLMDEKWRAHDSFFLSSYIDLDC